ncbi:hypothetical protein [Serratia quinivorans]|uniref:hypothetical protein n=1 Tax=Serratia quinivorans TaxID=137545 RepID=UPI002E778389|nr:hypothetical protein [Serratia quinivorans]
MPEPTIESLTTDSVNLSLRVTAIMRNIGYADCEEDVEVFKSMALSFSLDLTETLRKLEKIVYPGGGKK